MSTPPRPRKSSKSNKSGAARRDRRAEIGEKITAQIIAALADGVANPKGWKAPWVRLGGASIAPRNAITGRPYRGVNTVILWFAALENDYKSGLWATYNAWNRSSKCSCPTDDKGNKVHARPDALFDSSKCVNVSSDAKGKGVTVELWRPIIKKDEETGVEKRTLIHATYIVFPAELVNNAPKFEAPPAPVLPDVVEEDPELAAWFDGAIEVPVEYKGDRACYWPGADRINMPTREQFRSTIGFYGTLAHEGVHSTGHKDRLDRDLSGAFGTAQYGREELIAEMGSAFILGHLGISPEADPRTLDYLANWLEILNNDPSEILKAASAAQRAADRMIGMAEGVKGTEPEAAAETDEQGILTAV